MRLALDPEQEAFSAQPATEQLAVRVEEVLSAMTSPHIVAAEFVPAFLPNFPSMSPISTGHSNDARDLLVLWTRGLTDRVVWRNALTGRMPPNLPEVLDRTDEGSYGAALVFTENEAAVGLVSIKFSPDSRPEDVHLGYVGRLARILGSVIQSWSSVNTLALELADEHRRGQRLARQAERDGLTQLLNQQAFQFRCADQLGNPDKIYALLMIDVDKFKDVNDIYGHPFGDNYLREIARAIVRALPDTAIVGRIGGDEFAALLPVPTLCEPYLDRVMRACSSDVQRSAARLGKPDLGQISIGCALESATRHEIGQLLQDADAALYACKAAGRGVGVIFDSDQHGQYSALLMRPRFLNALKERRIQPFFQPVVSLKTGKPIGYEVLVRWQHSNLGLIGPDEFSVVLSTPELAEMLTKRIFETALAQFVEHPRYRKLHLSLNLGTIDLVKQEAVFDIQALLERHGVDWSQIIIEVTETTMLGNVNGPVFRNLTEFRSRGARVALDDFGTGYGGLSHLRSWPIDILKLDRSYVTTATAGEKDAVFVRALLQIAKTLGLSVIAEGVEDRETAKFLHELGCDMAQGYHFGQAMPLPSL